jgi:hypothetical protein
MTTPIEVLKSCAALAADGINFFFLGDTAIIGDENETEQAYTESNTSLSFIDWIIDTSRDIQPFDQCDNEGRNVTHLTTAQPHSIKVQNHNFLVTPQ